MLLIRACEIRRVGYTDRASAPLAMRSAGPRAADRPTIRACARVACVCRGFCARKAGLVHQVARAGAAGNRAIFWPRLGIILPRLRQKASLAGRTSGPFAIAAHLVGRHAHSFKHPPCSLLACSCRGFIFAPAHATDAHAAAAAADDNHRSRQPSRPHGHAQPPPSLPFGRRFAKLPAMWRWHRKCAVTRAGANGSKLLWRKAASRNREISRR